MQESMHFTPEERAALVALREAAIAKKPLRLRVSQVQILWSATERLLDLGGNILETAKRYFSLGGKR